MPPLPNDPPELGQRLPYQSGANDLIEGPFLGGYMEITAGSESATASGRRCGLLISDRLPADDARRAYYYSLMPNMMLSIHPDYVNYYMVTPVAVDRTQVVSEWMFNPASEGRPDFNPDDAVQMWDVTNRQDWDICERSQLGVSSRRYAPGPYSPRRASRPRGTPSTCGRWKVAGRGGLTAVPAARCPGCSRTARSAR